MNNGKKILIITALVAFLAILQSLIISTGCCTLIQAADVKSWISNGNRADSHQDEALVPLSSVISNRSIFRNFTTDRLPVSHQSAGCLYPAKISGLYRLSAAQLPVISGRRPLVLRI